MRVRTAFGTTGIVFGLVCLAWAIYATTEVVRLTAELALQRAVSDQAREEAAKSPENTSRDLATEETASSKQVQAVGPDPAVTPTAIEKADEGEYLAYEFEEFRDRLLRGELGLDTVMTAEAIERTLQERGRSADLLIAASMLSQDPLQKLAYLEEALAQDPTHPGGLAAWIGHKVSAGELNEETLEKIQTLQEVDPANSLANYYEALHHFQDGSPSAAVGALSTAAAKSRLTNYGLSHLPALETFYEDTEFPTGVARSLATFQLPLEYVGPLRELNEQILNELEATALRGDREAALTLAREGAQLGRTLSASGRYLISDLVGSSFEDEVLRRELEMQRQAGNASETARIERRLQANLNRRERLRGVGTFFTDIAAELNEEELLEYLQQVVTVGEDGAMLILPQYRQRQLEAADSDGF